MENLVRMFELMEENQRRDLETHNKVIAAGKPSSSRRKHFSEAERKQLANLLDSCPQFSDQKQHDVQEFLLFLLKYLIEFEPGCSATESESQFVPDCSRTGYQCNYRPENRKKRKLDQLEDNPICTKQRKCTQDSSSVEKLFQGKEMTFIHCLRCDGTSSRCHLFLDISVSIKEGESLQGSLEKYVAVERLEGQNKYKCEHCNTMTEANLDLKFSWLPQILMVHLKRTGSEGHKVSFPVECPKELKFNKYATQECPQRKVKYELFAMALHKGSSSSFGHYITLVNLTQDTLDQIRQCTANSFPSESDESDEEKPDSDSNSKKFNFLPEPGSTWLQFDDARVTYVPETEAMEWLKKKKKIEFQNDTHCCCLCTVLQASSRKQMIRLPLELE